MWLLIGDLHLTDRSQDAYRFDIFNWIEQQQKKHPVAATFLAGDITDSKDRHSATLVNAIVGGLLKLKPPVYIAMGNHDYRDNRTPFFKFLNNIEGLHFVTVPTIAKDGNKMAIIPHYRTQDEFASAVASVRGDCPYAFLVHQTFDGAIAESGVRLNGLSASPIESLKPPLGVYAGDVHKPQTQGQVIYVGCPYQVRFGDNFDPRCLLIDPKGKRRELWFPSPRKWALTVRDADNIQNNKDLFPGDQAKIVIQVTREEAVEWKGIRQRVLEACKEKELQIYGVKLEVNTNATTDRRSLHADGVAPSAKSIIEQFCRAEGLSKRLKETGMEIADGNKDIL